MSRLSGLRPRSQFLEGVLLSGREIRKTEDPTRSLPPADQQWHGRWARTGVTMASAAASV